MTAKKILLIGIIVIVIESIAGYLYLQQSQKSPEEPAPRQTSQPEVSVSESTDTKSEMAELSLETQSKNIKPGDNFSVNVILDTFSNQTTASDVTIKYDPQFLTSNKLNEPFTQSKIFQKTVFNKLDNKAGVATMSAVADIDKSFSGRGVLTTFTFRALKAGTTEIRIEFIPKDTRDSNIVSETADILESVQNLTLTIN